MENNENNENEGLLNENTIQHLLELGFDPNEFNVNDIHDRELLDIINHINLNTSIDALDLLERLQRHRTFKKVHKSSCKNSRQEKNFCQSKKSKTAFGSNKKSEIHGAFALCSKIKN